MKVVTNDPYEPGVLLWVRLQKHTSVGGDTPTMKSSIQYVLDVFNVVALPDTLDYLHRGERRVLCRNVHQAQKSVFL